jgi:hypothetical protein
LPSLFSLSPSLQLPGRHDVSSFTPPPQYSALPWAKSNGISQLWTETSETMSQKHLSSFKLFFSGVLLQ